MAWRIKQVTVCCLLIMVISACASRGREITQEMANSIVVGSTSRAELIESFGNPIGQTYNENGLLQMNWMYIYVGYAGIGSKTQILTVLFDDSEKVKKYTFTDSIPGDGVRLGR